MGHKNVPLFWSIIPTFVGGFLHFCISGKRNECSTEELQYLQLYINCVSTLPDKN